MGTYNIRVNDLCGDAIVQTYTIIKIDNPNLTILPFDRNCELLDCTTLNGFFPVKAAMNTTIKYPLTVQFTVNNPNGGPPTVINQTVNSGNANIQSVLITAPYYYNINTYYKIKVIDACGYVYILDNNFYKIKLSLLAQQADSCLNSIDLKLCGFVPPYTISFLSTPASFNPILYNSNHPGPFSLSETTYNSTTINSIPNGNYTIQVTDACGRLEQTNLLIENIEPSYKVNPDVFICGNSIIRIPAGDFPQVVSVILTNATPTYNHPLPYDVSFNIHEGIFTMSFAPGNYTFDVIDECGRSFTYVIEVFAIITEYEEEIIGANCTNPTGNIKIKINQYYNNNIIPIQYFFKPYVQILTSVIITNAPSGFPFPLPYNASNFIVDPDKLTFMIQGLPPGNYTVTVINNCGYTEILNLIVPFVVSQDPIVKKFRVGCGLEYSSIKLESPNGSFQTVIITAAPASFPHILPYNVSFNIATDGAFYMNTLPSGMYTFYTKDGCDVEKTNDINIQGYQTTSNIVNVIENCGSFNLYLFYSTNSSYNADYWLQKFNPITGNWEHPLTGVPYLNNNVFNDGSGIHLGNYATNLNYATTGVFRVLTEYLVYSNGSANLTTCFDDIKDFTYTGELKIVSAYSFPCVNGGTEVVVVANGVPPLDYKVTTKNGVPFIINNGMSNIFTSLQPAIYNFRIQDQCGNIVNRLFDIQTLPQPAISPSNLCEGISGQLSVQPFAFLNYEWWKGSDTGNILSTTNVLSFNPFSNTTTPGTYYVRIFAPNANSCVDQIISYTIPAISNPNAGQDGNLTLCGTSNSVNLFSILNGTYDAGGSWEEITASGMLSGNSWLPLGVSFGTYVFKYKVLGFCNTFDEALVTVNLNPITEIPVITVNPEFCSNESILFSVQNIPNATYSWSGPNGFISNIQNPIIPNSSISQSGIYTVTSTVNGCDSAASKTILIKPFLDFTVSQACVGGIYNVQVIPVGNSFEASTASYSWAGPNGYVSTTNPILITSQPKGIYTVTVSTSDTCSKTLSINITSTFCEIPNLITPFSENGTNQNFDLTGFDVDKLEIFSRWGRLVYNSNDYTNQWHGQNNNGGSLPGSTYYYFITLKSGEEKHGWLFLAQ